MATPPAQLSLWNLRSSSDPSPSSCPGSFGTSRGGHCVEGGDSQTSSRLQSLLQHSFWFRRSGVRPVSLYSSSQVVLRLLAWGPHFKDPWGTRKCGHGHPHSFCVFVCVFNDLDVIVVHFPYLRCLIIVYWDGMARN